MSNIECYIEKTKHLINYLEACISPEGDVFDASPSHLYFLARVVPETWDELVEMMPVIAAPVHWLVEYSGWVSVWYDFCMADEMTDKQLYSLKRLQESKRISDPYKVFIPKEKSICDARDSDIDVDIEKIGKRTLILTSGKII